MNTIAINKQGYPTNLLDIPCLVIALHTVPGHRHQDSRIAVNLIFDEVRKALWENENEDAEFSIGNYTFRFIRASEESEESEESEGDNTDEDEQSDTAEHVSYTTRHID